MISNREGQRVPKVTFRIRTEDGEWQTLTADDVFKDKTVVAFSLPGAFTPTCSSMHVPRYNELAPVFFANGVHVPSWLVGTRCGVRAGIHGPPLYRVASPIAYNLPATATRHI